MVLREAGKAEVNAVKVSDGRAEEEGGTHERRDALKAGPAEGPGEGATVAPKVHGEAAAQEAGGHPVPAFPALAAVRARE